MSPKFSVIMPVWNRADIVGRAIESVLAQSFRDYELLIIDDGSRDGLEKAVSPYLSESVRLLKTRHKGASAARNHGLKIARGDLIAYLDSDNVWHPQFLSEMHSAITGAPEPAKAAYCICNHHEKDKKTGQILPPKTVGEKFSFKTLLKRNTIDLNSFVHSRECIDRVGLFDEKLKRLIDWDFILRVAQRYDLLFVPKVLLDYYRGFASNSISLVENFEKAEKTVLDKSRHLREPIEIIHDTVKYVFDDLSDVKHHNWAKMKGGRINQSDFNAVGYPYVLQIEPTSRCNLGCPLCPVGRKILNREYRHMTLQEFKAIIDDMEKYLMLIVLWDWGEPLMNPELPDMISYAHARGIKTVTSTNAHFLSDESYLRRLLTSGLSTLIIAIDSLKEEKYEIYRKGGRLSKAVSGLERVMALKRELNSDTVINLRMVIMRQNEDELGDLRKLARSLKVDWFNVKTLNPSCGVNSMDGELVPSNSKYRRFKYKPGTWERVRKEGPCRRIWWMSNIFSNGDVVPCCWDFDAEMKIDNVFKRPFSEIWNSQSYRDLRKRVFHHKDAIRKCVDCTYSFEESKAGWFVEAGSYR